MGAVTATTASPAASKAADEEARRRCRCWFDGAGMSPLLPNTSLLLWYVVVEGRVRATAIWEGWMMVGTFDETPDLTTLVKSNASIRLLHSHQDSQSISAYASHAFH